MDNNVWFAVAAAASVAILLVWVWHSQSQRGTPALLNPNSLTDGESDDNIEMVAPAVQAQTNSER